MKIYAVILALSAALFCPAALAQQTCFTPPAASPVAAPTLDTIPPAAEQLITHTGAYAPSQANMKLAVVEVNSNEQQVWFGVDAAPGYGYVYYNRRYRSSSTSPWYWQYSQSIRIMSLGQTSVGANSVLYSPTAKYRDVYDLRGDIRYKYAMYLVSQPSACDGVVLGFLYVSFSNDGICWTPLQLASRNGGPSFPCAPELQDTVPVETVAAIDDGNTIYLIGMEGDATPLMDYAQMNRTQAYAGTASTSNPGAITLIGSGELSASGIVSPSGDTTNVYPDRYRPYNYLMNLDMAFDSTTGYLYVGRAYPYPFDRWGGVVPSTVPCQWQAEDVAIWDYQRSLYSWVQGCRPWPGTLPNRIQIYKMYIGSLAQFSNVLTGTWTLVSDIGGDVGYTNSHLGSCSGSPNTPRTDARQQNVGRDYAYVNFVRTPTGNLQLYSGAAYILAGDSFKLSKGASYCYVTGNEKVVHLSFPR